MIWNYLTKQIVRYPTVSGRHLETVLPTVNFVQCIIDLHETVIDLTIQAARSITRSVYTVVMLSVLTDHLCET